MIGFSRPAMATVRDETRMPGGRCTRGSGYEPDRLAKTGFPAKLYFEFHHFPFRFQPPLAGRFFYNQPPAVALWGSGLVK